LIKDLGIYSIILAQLNRETERLKRAPIMSDLRESGQIEQDADTICFLDKNKKDGDDGILRLKIAKNKNGPKNEAKLFFNKKITKFEGVSENEF
jgi:replicative DNA helicase